MVSASACAALLVSPYLQNYDFAILLIPFLAILEARDRKSPVLWLGAAFILPWLGLGLFGRGGLSALLLSALILSAELAGLTRAPMQHTMPSTS